MALVFVHSGVTDAREVVIAGPAHLPALERPDEVVRVSREWVG